MVIFLVRLNKLSGSKLEDLLFSSKAGALKRRPRTEDLEIEDVTCDSHLWSPCSLL